MFKLRKQKQSSNLLLKIRTAAVVDDFGHTPTTPEEFAAYVKEIDDIIEQCTDACMQNEGTKVEIQVDMSGLENVLGMVDFQKHFHDMFKRLDKSKDIIENFSIIKMDTVVKVAFDAYVKANCSESEKQFLIG